jgi:hypothetical protein
MSWVGTITAARYVIWQSCGRILLANPATGSAFHWARTHRPGSDWQMPAAGVSFSVSDSNLIGGR